MVSATSRSSTPLIIRISTFARGDCAFVRTASSGISPEADEHMRSSGGRFSEPVEDGRRENRTREWVMRTSAEIGTTH